MSRKAVGVPGSQNHIDLFQGNFQANLPYLLRLAPNYGILKREKGTRFGRPKPYERRDVKEKKTRKKEEKNPSTHQPTILLI